MALLALLVVAMVSTVILSAATSTVRQNKADQELQQNLLDLQSAGEFTKKSVEDHFNVELTATSTDNVSWAFKSVSADAPQPFVSALTDAIQEVYWSANADSVTTSAPRSFSIDAAYPSTENSEGQSRGVKASFVLKKNTENTSQFELVLTFNTAQNGAQTSGSGEGQVLYLTLAGSESAGPSKPTTTDKDNNTVEWERTYTYKCTGTSTFSTSNSNGGGQ